MSALGDRLTKVRELGLRAFARPIAYFSGEWERLAPKQRRTLAILVGTAVAIATLFVFWLVFSNIADLEEDNAATRDALSAIAKNREVYLDAKARADRDAQRIGNEPPQLTGDIEAAAREEQIEVAESTEQKPVPAGKHYIEHDVDIKIHEVGLQALTKFMRRLETQPRLIFFTKLSLKRRFSDAEKLEVEATATAFERVREDKVKKKPGEGAKKESGG